tara:strand:+ start:1633 stop:1782 length:150 start_codon:yes stop_codon:yes gene_type:complete
MTTLKNLIDPKLSDLLYLQTQEDWKNTKFWDGYICPVSSQVKVKKLDVD